MGIKGIYNELGGGERISLAKLAAEQLESASRPLRLAVDFSIWQFQAQAARGGANPAIRTLFFRLVRLLTLGIHPVFVIDGPHKPQIKRNKRSGRGGDAISSAMGRELIQLFGFRWHQAPGEAEAECALMQQMGLVDAVLSEDVDTIMFGCTATLRNWSPEGVRRVGAPTHVTVYRVGKRGNMTGIDRHGMVLVAMMSGGDYEPDGIPGFGVKIACEAARAGFGESLCMVKSESADSFAEWRESLTHELHTNESGFFRSKHKSLFIPDDFPRVETLQCYTHPVVSRKRDLMRAMTAAPWGKDPDLAGLRMFAQRTFDWQAYATTVKFVNLLAPGMLVHRLLAARTEEAKLEAQAFVMKIAKDRKHTSTDGLTEMRVIYVPSDVVQVELPSMPGEQGGMLPFGRDGLAINSDGDDDSDDDDPDLEYLSDIPGSGDDEAEAEAAEILPKMNPDEPQLTWLLEGILRVGAPSALADYEKLLLQKMAKKAGKGRKKKKAGPDPDAGAILKFLKPTKKSKEKTPEVTELAASPIKKMKVKKRTAKSPDGEPDGEVARPRRKKKAVIDLDSDATVDSGSEADVEDEPRVSTPKRKLKPKNIDSGGPAIVSPKRRRPEPSKIDAVIEPGSPPKRRGTKKSEAELEPRDPSPSPPKRRRAKQSEEPELEVELQDRSPSPPKNQSTPKKKKIAAAIELGSPPTRPSTQKPEDPELDLDLTSSPPKRRSRPRKIDTIVEPESPPRKRRTKKSEEPEHELDLQYQSPSPPMKLTKKTTAASGSLGSSNNTAEKASTRQRAPTPSSSTTSASASTRAILSSEPVLSPARLTTKSKQLPTTAAVSIAASAAAPAPAPAPNPLLIDSPSPRPPTFDRSHIDDLLFPRTPQGIARRDAGESQTQTIIILDSPSSPAFTSFTNLTGSTTTATTTITTSATGESAMAIPPPPESSLHDTGRSSSSWKNAHQTLTASKRQAPSTIAGRNKQSRKGNEKNDGAGMKQISIMNFATASKKSRVEAPSKIHDQAEQARPSRDSYYGDDDPFLDRPLEPKPVFHNVGKKSKPTDILPPPPPPPKPTGNVSLDPPEMDQTALKHTPLSSLALAPGETVQQSCPSVTGRTTKRMMIPRLSGGFFEIVEMSVEEAAEIEETSHRPSHRVCRFSDVSIVDLTGED